MKLEILGSGGAVATPKPFCPCEVCRLARAGGPADGRLGPSVFVHGPDLLIDTPEEIAVQLNRSAAPRVAACVYSHWHPDHTAGRRLFEMNKDWNGWPARNRSTKVVLTESIARSFRDYMGIMTHFDFLAGEGLVDLMVVGDTVPWELGTWRIRPVPLGNGFAFAWSVEGEGKRLLVVMDEIKGWEPAPAILASRWDLVYLPLGIYDRDAFTGRVLMDPAHPILQSEQTVDETLALAARLDTPRLVLSHIEEPDGIGRALGERLGRLWSGRLGREVILAWDTMVIEV
jgi:phosphoribosyl 1,2-cyclic phosphate phosphodiesterase